jgi:DNA-binding NtrC family response regulator
MSNSVTGLVTNSKAMQEIMHTINLAASIGAPLLITGESGTGKKMVAKTIHDLSRRADRAFVLVQCTEASEELIESEIFGSESRLFGKVRSPRIGCFELAGGGSLIFDDIDNLSDSMQLRVLRIFEAKKIRPLGARDEVPVDVRIMATMEWNSQTIAFPGRLRPELFTFLQPLQVHVPPLRSRREDFLSLIQNILRESNTRNGKNIVGLSTEVSELFLSHVWPGNIRELQSVLEHAVIYCDGELISRRHLPVNFGRFPLPLRTDQSTLSFPYGATLEIVERALISQTLSATNGNKTSAARLLGISLKTLHNKLKEYKKSPTANEETSEMTFPLGLTVGKMERELITHTLKQLQNNKTRAADLLGISLKTLHNKLKLYATDHKSE